MAQKRYRVLRFIGGFYKVVAIILAVLTVLSAIAFCATSVLGTSIFGGMFNGSGVFPGMPMMSGAGVVGGIIGGLFTILFGAIFALALYGFGELIYLFIAIEENTRVSSMK